VKTLTEEGKTVEIKGMTVVCSLLEVSGRL
jgi:hypothetical protein